MAERIPNHEIAKLKSIGEHGLKDRNATPSQHRIAEILIAVSEEILERRNGKPRPDPWSPLEDLTDEDLNELEAQILGEANVIKTLNGITKGGQDPSVLDGFKSVSRQHDLVLRLISENRHLRTQALKE